MIAGLYRYVRGGRSSPPVKTLEEIPISLAVNPWYRDGLLFLASDMQSAGDLEAFGLRVHRVFDDAPEAGRQDAAHKMKHWMCLWAVREFGEVLWIDWDTVSLRRPDDDFWAWARAHATPKFIHIPGYWAIVNCGVYFTCAAWATAIESGLSAPVSEPNDELLWASVLPGDVLDRPEFWWGPRVVNVWSPDERMRVSEKTYFAHVRDLGYAALLRRQLGG
jgi:hypothetical protein